MVSIHWPLGYGPSTLPLRHPAATAPGVSLNPRPSHLSAFGSAYKDNALSNWATGAYICGVIDVPILCKIKNWRSKNRKYSMDSKNRWHEYIAGNGFDPSTSGLWAQHASTAPPCFNCSRRGSNPRPSHLSSGTAYKYDALTNWATGAHVFYVI